MIIDCISDLHGHYPTLEGGDLLIVAGDLTASDQHHQYEEFFIWLSKQDYRKKVFISGNHDNQGMSQFDWHDYEWSEVDYLKDSGTKFEGLNIWGSPWTRTFEGMNPHCKAFTCETDVELNDKWKLIPENTDILITHCPPWGIQDSTGNSKRIGSFSLLEKFNRKRFNPKLHVFGHLHEGYGVYKKKVILRLKPQFSIKEVGCKFVNASHVNEIYQPINKPIRMTL
jgi:Icc-related predicted phosphoesterase